MTDNRRRRRRRSSSYKDTVNLITAIALIAIAILLLIFVFMYIKNGSVFSILGFGSDSTGQSQETPDESTADGDESLADDAGTAAAESYGLMETAEGLVYVVSPDEEADYGEDSLLDMDGVTVLAGTWYDDGSSLYYFGTDGYAASEYSEEAMEYSFDSDGKLERISYNDNYRRTGSDTDDEYPAVVKTKTLWAFIDTDRASGSICPIMYKKTTDSLSHELGGDTNPQYTTDYAMSVCDGYIYYLALAAGSGSSAVPENIAGKLFRMKPGADSREIAAEDVEGYKLIESGNKVVVYYDDGRGIVRTDSTRFKNDESMRIFDENASYYVDTDSESGKAYLMVEGGYPVTLASDSFQAGNFKYKLAADGEILSVITKTTVNTGGYTYSIESGESFGTVKSRVIRKDSAGTTEVISSEFDGTTGNVHYDYNTSSMIAEYTDGSGNPGVLKISLDGDVDLLSDSSNLSGSVKLYDINNGEALVATGSDGRTFEQLRISASYPIAVGVDATAVIGTEPQTESETAAAETISPSGTGTVTGTGTDTGGTAGTGTAEDYDTAVMGAPGSSQGTVVDGPGASVTSPNSGVTANTQTNRGPGYN